jgi:hypothetical protein
VQGARRPARAAILEQYLEQGGRAQRSIRGPIARHSRKCVRPAGYPAGDCPKATEDFCKALSTARNRLHDENGFPRNATPCGSCPAGTQPDISMMAHKGERSRICCANSGPHIPGIMTSVTTRSNPPRIVTISSAWSGPVAVVVSYPALSSTLATTDNTAGSSSTTRIVGLATPAPLGQWDTNCHRMRSPVGWECPLICRCSRPPRRTKFLRPRIRILAGVLAVECRMVRLCHLERGG